MFDPSTSEMPPYSAAGGTLLPLREAESDAPPAFRENERAGLPSGDEW